MVPRYGADIRGGAETGRAMLAEHLVADRGPHGRGADHLRPRRHHVARRAGRGDRGRQRGAGAPHSLAGRTRRQLPSSVGAVCGTIRPAPAPRTWSAGSTCRGRGRRRLLDAVAASDADVLAFYPYLYYPTVRGLPLVEDRAILHPAAHEEPALHLPIFDDLFRRCRGFAFHSRSERALVHARFGVASDAPGAGRPGRRGAGSDRRRSRGQPLVRGRLRIGRGALPGLHRPGGRREGDRHAVARPSGPTRRVTPAPCVSSSSARWSTPPTRPQTSC